MMHFNDAIGCRNYFTFIQLSLTLSAIWGGVYCPPKGKLQCRPLIQMMTVGLMKQGRATFNLLQVAVTSLDNHNIERTKLNIY